MILLPLLLGSCYGLQCPAEFGRPSDREFMCGPGTLGGPAVYAPVQQSAPRAPTVP